MAAITIPTMAPVPSPPPSFSGTETVDSPDAVVVVVSAGPTGASEDSETSEAGSEASLLSPVAGSEFGAVVSPPDGVLAVVGVLEAGGVGGSVGSVDGPSPM